MILLMYRLVSEIDILIIDECTISYKPTTIIKHTANQNGEPIPLVYIPRKPHPNGLFLYLGVLYIPHPTEENSVLPFIIDIIPHLKVNDISPTEAVKQMIQR
jgi:hypothetical protein